MNQSKTIRALLASVDMHDDEAQRVRKNRKSGKLRKMRINFLLLSNVEKKPTKKKKIQKLAKLKVCGRNAT